MSKSKLGTCKTTNKAALAWVDEMTKLCQPDRIFWCDGSEQENQMLCDLMVASGTLTKLNEKLRPGCYLARSHPSDVARVEDHVHLREDTGRSRSDQQLGRPRRDEGDTVWSLQRQHEGTNDVRDSLRHGTARFA